VQLQRLTKYLEVELISVSPPIGSKMASNMLMIGIGCVESDRRLSKNLTIPCDLDDWNCGVRFNKSMITSHVRKEISQSNHLGMCDTQQSVSGNSETFCMIKWTISRMGGRYSVREGVSEW
jgi:hypothetical protein